MTDVIIIRPISHSWSEELYMRYVTIPHGPLHLAAPLVESGYNVKIIDEVVEDNAENELRKNLKKNPICVGISSMTGMQIKNGLKFAEIVRDENENLPIIWGGAHPTILPITTLDDPLVDIVVCGEGEKTFPDLVSCLEKEKSLKDVSGIYYKDNGNYITNQKRCLMNLDDIPELPYHLIKMEVYITSIKKRGINRYFEIHTSRGCPYGCAFCYNSVHNKKWRTKSAERILENLKFLIHNYGIDGITWEDEIFSFSKERITNICNGIIDEGIDIKLRAGVRVDHFSNFQNSFIELMKKAGFIHFGFGVESGSEKILRYINKHITIKQIHDVVKKVKENGFLATYNFMTGFPNETAEDFAETLKLIHQIFKSNQNMLYPVSGPSFYTPFPETKLYYEALDLGFIPPNTFREWAKFDYNNMEMPWVNKNFSQIMYKAKHVVADLNQKFIGEDARIDSTDYKPLEEMIRMCSSIKNSEVIT